MVLLCLLTFLGCIAYVVGQAFKIVILEGP